MSLQPDFRLQCVEEVTPQFLQQNKIRLLIFDADATLIQAHDDKILPERVTLIETIMQSGVRVMVLSNGKTTRIEKAFDTHRIEAYGYTLKPLPFRLLKRIKGYRKEEVLLVGDQLFTDILCAKLSGIRSAMVSPYGVDEGFLMGFRRWAERKIIKEKN